MLHTSYFLVNSVLDTLNQFPISTSIKLHLAISGSPVNIQTLELGTGEEKMHYQVYIYCGGGGGVKEMLQSNKLPEILDCNPIKKIKCENYH